MVKLEVRPVCIASRPRGRDPDRFAGPVDREPGMDAVVRLESRAPSHSQPGKFRIIVIVECLRHDARIGFMQRGDVGACIRGGVVRGSRADNEAGMVMDPAGFN